MRAVIAGVVFAWLVSAPSTTHAQPAQPSPRSTAPTLDPGAHTTLRDRETPTYVNLRVGLSSADTNERPTICVEARVVSELSLETCGTGAGILHNADGHEMAHFRGKWKFADTWIPIGRLRAQAGVGFAELQLGDDDPGFVFGNPDGGSSAAGPEAALVVQLATPLAGGTEMISSITGGAAYLDGAGDLSVPQDRTQLFLSFEVGVGF